MDIVIISRGDFFVTIIIMDTHFFVVAFVFRDVYLNQYHVFGSRYLTNPCKKYTHKKDTDILRVD